MAKDKLENFRIADLKRPEVRSFKVGAAPGSAPAEEPAAASAGFPSIEARLESSSMDAIAEELRASYGKLEELADGNNMKAKSAAKKALGAYERVADLFEYLFATKASIKR
jgi:hypothetical protein